MKYLYLTIVLLYFLPLTAQRSYEAEEFTNSAGVTFMIYPDGKTVTKADYDEARRLIDEASSNFNEKAYSDMLQNALAAERKDPNYWLVYDYQALYYGTRAANNLDYGKASRLVEKAISLSKPNARLEDLRSMYLRRDKKYAPAIEAAKAAIRIDPDYQDAYFSLAYSQAELNQHRDAIKNYYLAIDKGFYYKTDCYFNIGLSYEALNENEKAKGVYLDVLRIDPNYSGAKTQLAKLEELAPSRPGTVWLIAVGINNYQYDYLLTNLSFPALNAYEVVRIFEGRNMLQEKAVVLVNGQATRTNIVRELNSLNATGKVQSNDLVIFYYSGHGEMAGSKIGICPYNYAGAQDLISDQEIARLLNKLPAKHKVAIIESCKTETQTAAPVPANKLDQFNRSRKNITGGLAYITSTKAGQFSYGNRSLGGYFTYHLRNALDTNAADTNGDNTVTLDEMFQYVRRETSKQTNGKQVPEMNSSGFDKSMPIMFLN